MHSPILGNRCRIIAEVGQSHDGSLGLAHAYIDAIAKAGADGVKFQTHIAEAESSCDEPWRVKFSCQDETRFDYWKRMEFTEEQWRGLKKHAGEKNLLFITSPFSTEAVDMMSRVGVSAWKVASGEINNLLLIDRLLDTGQTLLISTGMSPLNEIETTVNRVKKGGNAFALLQCSSIYPCPPEKVGLNLISELRNRFKCFVGLSDHSGVIFPGLAAAALGIDVLEVHVTLSREMFGPDVNASLTTFELGQLVEGIRFIEKMVKNPVDKDVIARDLQPMREIFTKSLVALFDLPAGTILETKHLTSKKPGRGITADRINSVCGRRLAISIKSGEFLKEGHLA